MTKKTVCLLFGGKSGEHEISFLSARSIFQAIDKKKYEVLLIGIDKEGRWHLSDTRQLSTPKKQPLESVHKNLPEVQTIIGRNSPAIIASDSQKIISSVDVFFPITHGTYGEDGSLQGYLELLDAAYVGSGVLGSAVCMDKDIMKRLLRESNLPVGEFYTLKKGQEKNLSEFVSKLGFPLFVKPANMGSSVGVSKVHNEKELISAMEEAFLYDTKILLEKEIIGREIEVSVLGNDDPIASIAGEIKPTHEFYDYEAKYIDEKGATLSIPAKLSKKEMKEVQTLAVAAFKALGCSGMARVDFFLTKEGKWIINELNTLPGFTSISMYPKLWEESRISFADLISKLIELALESHDKKKKLKRTYF